jgi:hypothetical protein
MALNLPATAPLALSMFALRILTSRDLTASAGHQAGQDSSRVAYMLAEPLPASSHSAPVVVAWPPSRRSAWMINQLAQVSGPAWARMQPAG